MGRTTIFALLGFLGLLYSAGSVIGSEDQLIDDGTVDAVKMLYLGYELSITCNLTNMESLPFELKWFKDGIPLDNTENLKIFPENSSLYIPNPEKADVGEYKCQTDVETKTISVIYFQMGRMDKSKVITEGEDLTIDCPVEGHPPPDIKWLKDEELVKIEDKISILHNVNEMPNGQLKLSGIQLDQRGHYKCVVTTKEKEYDLTTFVRVKSVYAALWPSLGILVEMIILGITIFICEKHCDKTDVEESDTDNGND